MPAEEPSKRVGAHQLVLEQDLVVFRQRGDYTLSDAREVGAELASLIARRGRIFVIIDQTQAGTTPPESRRFLADWNKRHTLGGVALFGGSVTARAVASLITTAIRLVRPAGAPMVFTATEAEARAWVASQRTRT
jgi:hypothetical protein